MNFIKKKKQEIEKLEKLSNQKPKTYIDDKGNPFEMGNLDQMFAGRLKRRLIQENKDWCKEMIGFLRKMGGGIILGGENRAKDIEMVIEFERELKSFLEWLEEKNE